MKLQHHRALSSVIGLVTATVLTISGLAVTGPSAQAVDKPTPMSHTIDFVVVSTTDNTDYLSDANIAIMTAGASDAWRRMSRGVVTEIKVGQIRRLTQFSEADFCALDTKRWPSTIATALGHSIDVYRGRPNGRHLVVYADYGQTLTCGYDGMTLDGGDSLSAGGIMMLRYMGNWTGAFHLVHEMGHMFGLPHAAAVGSACSAEYWDGPYLDAHENFPTPEYPGCPYGLQSSWYGDDANVMGANQPVDTTDLNGQQKYDLGLIHPGAGLVQVTAAANEQLITIHDVHTPDLDLPQTIRMTADDPDGDGPCAAPVYAIDYDPVLGGVRVFRVAMKDDCGTTQMSYGLSEPGTFAWSVLTIDPDTFTTSTRLYFLPGETRLTQSGNVQVKVVSADPSSGTATVSIRRTDVPGFATVQVNSSFFGPTTTAMATGGEYNGVVTTNQASWTAASDQPWVTVTGSGTAGGTVAMSVAPNLTTQQRTAAVTIRAGNATTTMTVVQVAGDQSLANDCGTSPQTACSWADLDSPLTSTIDTYGDKDWFRFSPVTTGTYIFTSSKPAVNPLRSIGGMVRMADGKPVPAVSTSSGSQQIALTTQLTGGETYYLEVQSYGSPGTGAYTITATRGATVVAVSPRNFSVPGEGGSQSIQIDTAGTWYASLQTWVTAARRNGTGPDSLTLTIAPNTSGRTRTGTISVQSAGQSAWLTITQPAVDDACGGSGTSYCTWTDLDKPITGRLDYKEDVDLFRFTAPTTGTWVLTATGTPLTTTLYTADARTEIATGWGAREQGPKSEHVTAFLTAGQTYYFKISTTYPDHATGDYTLSAAPSDTASLTLSAFAVLWEPRGGTQTIQVSTAWPWTVTIPDWITASPPSGSGTTTVTLTAVANTTGATKFDYIRFKTGDYVQLAGTMQMPVLTQALTVSTNAVTAAAAGDTKTVRISAPGSWRVDAPNWVTVSQASGSGDGSVTLTITANDTGQPRVGTVTVTADDETATVAVSQEPLEPTPVETLSVSPMKVDAAAGGDTQTLQITASGDWTVTAPTWASVDPASGHGNGSVTITTTANNTGQARTDNITITSGTKKATIALTQPAQPVVTLSVSPTSVSVQPDGGTTTLTITAGGAWELTTPDWVTASQTSGTGNQSVSLTTGANRTGYWRSDSVTVTGGGVTKSMTISQGTLIVSLSLSTDRVTFSGDGGTQQVTLTSDMAWYAAMYGYTPVTLSQTKGTGDATLTLTMPPNTTGQSRNDVIIFVAGGQILMLSITQLTGSGPVETLQVSPTSVDSAMAGDSHSLDVTASGDWRITAPSWVSLSQASGTGNTSVTVTTTANNTGAPRTGDITITSQTKTAKVSVTQAGVRDDCGDTAPTSCAWPDLSTPVTGTLEYPGDKDWYKFTAAQSGPYVLSASATATEPVRKTTGTLYDSNGTRVANDSSGAESYQFRITAELTAGQTYYLQVTGVGTGNYTVTATPPKTDKFTLSTTAFNPGVNGGSLLVQVTAEVDWQVRAPDWIKTKDSAGFGDTPVYLTAEANNTGSPRIGEIVFTSGRQTITVWVHQTNVRQVATTLDVTPASIATASPKVESIKIQILTDGDWTIEGQWPAEGPPNAYLWPLSGTGDTVVTLNIKPTNPGTHTSSHTNIKVTAGNNTKSIPVDQDPWD